MVRISFVRARFFVFFLTIASLSVSADSGTDWLASQVQDDGGVYAATDLANPTQSSLEALTTRLLVGAPAAVDPSLVANYLAQSGGTDTELLATKLIAGVLQTPEGVAIAGLLQQRQNDDGGFGNAAGSQSTPYDTYWAVKALAIAGALDASSRYDAIQFLINSQRANGAWGYITTDSVYLTGRIRGLLAGYQSVIATVSEALGSARAYLIDAELNTTPLSVDFFGPCVALSSLSNTNTSTDLTDLADRVLNGQDSGGSWQGDVFSTAICLRALLQYEASQQGSTQSSVAGQVVVSGSSQPLSGVRVTSSNNASINALTDAHGRFSLVGLNTASLNLALSKSGYLDTVKSAFLVPGANDLGAIPLAQDDGNLRVSGSVVDAASGLPLSGVQLSLSGAASYQVSTDSSGVFYLSDVDAGAYTIEISRAGYHSSTSAVSLSTGTNYDYRIQLNAVGTVLDDTPGDLTGRIVDGATGLPLANASVSLGSSGTVTSSASGLFSFATVARGDHTLILAAAGYTSVTYNLTYPPGSAGVMGDLSLYALSGETAADSVDLTVLVRDALSGLPIPGASVAYDGTAVSTAVDGKAILNGIGETSFTLEVSAAQYLPRVSQVTLSGFGEVSIELSLTPASDETAESISLQGTVSDANGVPLEGVVLDINGAGLGVLSDDAGAYAVTDIDVLTFSLTASKAGFRPYTQSISVTQFGNYFLDFSLEPVSNQGWQVYYVNPPEGILVAHSDATFTASLQNLEDASAAVIVRGQVFTAAGEPVADIAPFTPGTTVTDPLVNFAAGEVKVLSFPFNTGQLVPGQYLVKVDVVEPGSISQDLPTGVVYSSNATHIDITPSYALEGDVTFDPPVAQAGAVTPVALRVLLVNTGNDVLTAGNYTLTIGNEAGDILETRTVSLDAVAAGNVVRLDFGEWVPTEAGHLSVHVVHGDLLDAGEILGMYYVGDVALADFTLDQQVFPEGDNQTGATLQVRGVDTTQGSSTDPLFERAIDAVRVGGQYVGDQALAWHRSNRCLGCHIQTQSLVGMASSLPFTDIDEDETRFLFNVIATSQQNDGRMRISHNSDSYMRTQQQLATWALAEWPDKAAAHRTKLKGLQYLWSRRTVSGNRTYWVRDHQTGWLATCCEGSTAVATRAIVEFLQADASLQDTPLLDYQMGANIALTASRQRPRGMHQDGDVLTIAKQGMIERVDLSQGTKEVLYLDGNNRQFYDVAVDSDGTLYATTATSVLKITVAGDTEEVYLSASGLVDIVFWDGDLYVSDYDDNRIWRVTTDLDAVAFAVGGLLSGPYGLSVSVDGAALLATNWNGYNVVAVDPQGVVALFADGLAFRPGQIVPAGDGESYYISTQIHSRDGATSPAALHLLRPDKTAVHLVGRTYSTISLYALAVSDGRVLFTDYSSNVLGTVNFSELDRSFANTVQAALPNIANYFLNAHQNNDSEITRVAFRLMGLAEIEKVTTDPTLLAQIAAAKDYIAQLLRNRQRSDGGWGRYVNSGSDPLTTAWVGYALDYTDPSAEDPMVRNAITYLLNTQSGNGSWSGQYFSTRLGSTSMVMAYMPRALNRLGGLDVGLELTLPQSIELLNASIAPDTSEVLGDGAVHYQWDMVGVTSSGRNIDMDLGIIALALGEQRPVADLAQLHFANSFTGEILTRPIDIPSVTAVSDIGLTTGTDKTTYLAHEVVAIDNVVSNGESPLTDGTLTVSIKTAQGDFIDQVIVGAAVNLPANTPLTVASQWHTGLYPAGPYQVFAEVANSAGEVQAQAVAAFSILPSDGDVEVGYSDAYDTHIATDQQIYTPYANVQLSSKVINTVLNATQAPVLAAVRVSGPGGQLVYSKNIVINELAAGAVNSYLDFLPLNDAPAGLYYAGITVWNAAVTETLASSETLFSVIEQPLAHLVGTVSVDDESVYRGQAVTCSEQVNNRSLTVSVDAQLIYRVVNVDEQLDVSIETDAHVFTPGLQTNTSHVHATADLAPGGYACVLEAQVGESVTTLDFAGFTVLLPPVEYTVYPGARGRLLILMDEPGGNGSNGTRDIASLALQESYLRNLLETAGFSYTLVFNDVDFTREFYSGNYHSYALMSEKVGLPPEVEEQLGEAVNAGAGLYIAGAFNRRNNHIEKVLGIESTGRDQKADGVIIPQGALGPDWPEAVFNPHTKLDFERCGATVLGAYINPKKGTATTELECYNLTETDAAVVAYHYGRGNAVYAGFDTLDEAALVGGSNVYSQLMLYTLDFIQPDTFPVRQGAILPFAVEITSEEIPVQVQVLFDLPPNLAAVDQIPTMMQTDVQNNIWRWDAQLGEFDTANALFYARLLDGEDAEISVSVGVEIEDAFIEIGSTEFLWPSQAARDFLTDGIVLLQALVMNYPDDNDFAGVLAYAQSALATRADGDVQGAVDDLLSAVTTLADSEVFDAQEARWVLDVAMFELLKEVAP
ncbi:MAG: carboxypeptidase regulatory-like domain-containing protein [Pseudomonadales bacterium]|nr:carboxypeptidase regulatory-like domain-containing protein [Pseudomonadales bacterium]